jgi:hypothetical protein
MLNFRLEPVLVSVFLLAITTEVWGMGLFESLKVCLFSEVNGTVLMKGKPVAGAEVIQTAQINSGKTFTYTTITDEQGRFHFDARFSHSINKITPVQPRVPQNILFRYQGKEYGGWKTSKHNYDVGGEINSLSARQSSRDLKKIVLKCDLADESRIKEQEFGSNIIGMCEFQSACNT